MRRFRRRPRAATCTGRIYGGEEETNGRRSRYAESEVPPAAPAHSMACPVCLPWPGASAAPQNQESRNSMVVIRLARGGAKKRPFYNIVVADSRERRDGRFIERVGFYNPVAAGGDQPLRVALDRVTHWAGVGAQLSPTVRRLVEQAKKAAA
jgi:small subunit ribosomal protein S16